MTTEVTTTTIVPVLNYRGTQQKVMELMVSIV